MPPPPPDSAPTLGEVLRRLDDISTRFDRRVDDVSAEFARAAQDIRDFRNWAERLFVPRGEWLEGRRADGRLVDEVKADVTELKGKEITAAAAAETRAAADLSFRRTVMVTVIAAALSGVISVVVMIANILFGGG